MAEPLFAALQFLHITGAAVVLGFLAFAPLWRASAVRATEAGIVRHTVDLMRTSLVRVAFPAFAILFLSGIAMSFRETSQGLYTLNARWIQAGIVIAIVLGVMLWGLLGPLRKMAPLLEAGEPKGAATDKLWGEWRTSLLMASILALVATGLMIYQSWV